jgi:hypothetical protein
MKRFLSKIVELVAFKTLPKRYDADAKNKQEEEN